jgi:hypothetical protein
MGFSLVSFISKLFAPYRPNKPETRATVKVAAPPPFRPLQDVLPEKVAMPALTTTANGKFDEIPGPLGLASASLAGKVALVTGAGK